REYPARAGRGPSRPSHLSRGVRRGRGRTGTHARSLRGPPACEGGRAGGLRGAQGGGDRGIDGFGLRQPSVTRIAAPGRGTSLDLGHESPRVALPAPRVACRVSREGVKMRPVDVLATRALRTRMGSRQVAAPVAISSVLAAESRRPLSGRGRAPAFPPDA